MSVGEWDERQLCPDGACVGVIGDNGQCKVCGRVAPNWGEERKRGLVETTDADDEEQQPMDEGEGDGVVLDGSEVSEWSSRKLCSDGACIGVIGANGVCTVCGKKPEKP